MLRYVRFYHQEVYGGKNYLHWRLIMSKSLFERLGGIAGITNIANDVIDNHLANKTIATRFSDSDIEKIKNAAATFFISGTGGPDVYKGKDMLAAHKGMNISAAEFMAVLDDALAALKKNNIDQREQEEVLFVLYSMRSQIVLV
jgi:hemoglobin